MEPPNLLVRLLHSVPHVNISLHPVNSTFNPKSSVYIEVSFVCVRRWRRSELRTIALRANHITHMDDSGKCMRAISREMRSLVRVFA